MERKLVTLRFKYLDSEDNPVVGSNLSRMMSNPKVECENYVFSGQCVVANFGFVKEQAMHMDFDPNKA